MKLDLTKLLPSIIDLAQEAGQAIQVIYETGDFGVVYKEDNSPLSRADLAANQIIVKGLQALTPDILIISEESAITPFDKRRSTKAIWFVDPLDGTKGFINKSPDYTVNIGLVVDGVPVLGVVYAPSRQVLYYGAEKLGAFKQADGQAATPISSKQSSLTGTKVIAASFSDINKDTRNYLDNLGPHQLLKRGSSLKVCYVADGTVAQYPRFYPCMEWDTAASDAVLRAAGGIILQADIQEPLAYNKADLHNPSFIALPVRP